MELTEQQKEYILKFDSLGKLMVQLGRAKKKLTINQYKEIVDYFDAFKVDKDNK